VTSFRVAVTAEHIAAGVRPKKYRPGWRDPVELALAEFTGQDVDTDGTPAIATIGQGAWTLVIDLPPFVGGWLDLVYAGKPVEPFEFEIEIPEWIHALVEAAA
jgi:hypothetical protein